MPTCDFHMCAYLHRNTGTHLHILLPLSLLHSQGFRKNLLFLGRRVSCPSAAWEVACIPWLLVSSIFRAQQQESSSAATCLVFTFSFPFCLQGFCDSIGSIGITFLLHTSWAAAFILPAAPTTAWCSILSVSFTGSRSAEETAPRDDGKTDPEYESTICKGWGLNRMRWESKLRAGLLCFLTVGAMWTVSSVHGLCAAPAGTNSNSKPWAEMKPPFPKLLLASYFFTAVRKVTNAFPLTISSHMFSGSRDEDMNRYLYLFIEIYLYLWVCVGMCKRV